MHLIIVSLNYAVLSAFDDCFGELCELQDCSVAFVIISSIIVKYVSIN